MELFSELTYKRNHEAMLQSRDATVAFMYVDFTRLGVARPGNLTVEQLIHVGDIFRTVHIRSDLPEKAELKDEAPNSRAEVR